MNNALVGLIFSLLLFSLTAWVLFGWGSILTRLFQINLPGAEGVFSQLWVGWAVVLLLLQLLNFVMPLNWLATTLVAIGGIAAWWYNRRRVVRSPISKTVYIYASLMLLSTCWIAFQSMRAPEMYDSGLYHLQSVRWLNEYAIVPGLGNLHGRLAFNQSFFTFAAALNLYPFFNNGHALANGFLLLLLIAEGWHALLFRRGEHSLSRFAAIIIMPVTIYIGLRGSPSSPTPDIASSILQIIIWIYFVRYMEKDSPTSINRARIYVIFILAAAAVTVKISSLFFVAIIGLIILVREWKIERQSLQVRFAYFIRLFWFPLLIILVWVGRGYFLSGYPVYPASIGAISTDWTMPVEMVESESYWIYRWARYGGEPLREGTWAWLPLWLQNFRTARVLLTYPLAMTGMLLVALGITRLILPARKQQGDHLQHVPQQDPQHEFGQSPPYWLALMPILLGIVIWWFTVPDPRFARSFFWLLPVVLAYRLLERLDEAQWGSPRLNFVVALVVLNGAFLATLAGYWQQAVSIGTGFGPIPTAPLVSHTLPGPLTVWSTREGDRCWDSELPCTPYFNEWLRLRGATLQQGFMIIPPDPGTNESDE